MDRHIYIIKKRSHRKGSVCLMLFLWFIVLAHATQAYVLNGHHILDLTVKTIGTASGCFSGTQTLVVYTDDPEPKETRFNETVYYVFPERFRSDITSDGQQRIYLSVQGNVLGIVDGHQDTEASESLHNTYKDILLYRNRLMLERYLTSKGVNVTISSLGRFEDISAFVIGGDYPDQSTTQLWINKDTFLPFRWILVEQRNDATHPKACFEVRYKDWRQFNKIWFPKQIEMYEDGKRIRQILVQDITALPYEESLFDIMTIQRQYSVPQKELSSPNKEEGMSDVQKMLEEFKKKYKME
ncbi:MAG: hypothetical protein HQK77_12615 [Desulfobacterales bacterium]|nr:hypothetical protein [Desulfobacterales bacterium]